MLCPLKWSKFHLGQSSHHAQDNDEDVFDYITFCISEIKIIRFTRLP